MAMDVTYSTGELAVRTPTAVRTFQNQLYLTIYTSGMARFYTIRTRTCCLLPPSFISSIFVSWVSSPSLRSTDTCAAAGRNRHTYLLIFIPVAIFTFTPSTTPAQSWTMTRCLIHRKIQGLPLLIPVKTLLNMKHKRGYEVASTHREPSTFERVNRNHEASPPQRASASIANPPSTAPPSTAPPSTAPARPIRAPNSKIVYGFHQP